MPEINSIADRASEYVFDLFKTKLPENLVYHNYAHTQSVVDAVHKIAKGIKLGEEGMEVVVLAAWFHDTGFTEIYKGHESESIEIARKFLLDAQYPQERIALVEGCIAATRAPQKPQNVLEEILCDADMSSLGKKSYFDRLGLLRIELERTDGTSYSDEEWEKENLEFMMSHKYFTRTGQKEYEEQKQENIRELDKRIRKRMSPGRSPKDEAALAKLRLEEQRLALQAEKDTRPDRGVETMFKLLSRNHMDLSAQADHKAQTLILTNALILSILLPFTVRRLEIHSTYAIPGCMLLAVCVTTIIFAVLAMRPKIASGMFTRESIEKKQANLMFFGNFYRMPYADYEWGLGEMMKDKEYLYGSLIKDSYFHGKVIGKKYNYLRWSYNVFMYGLAGSVLLFIWIYLLSL
jgi:predicted metal-dependent HD superfamily phosphohydrolase